MSKKAVEHIFVGNTSPITSYNQNNTNLGELIKQYTGLTSLDRYVGPSRIGIARPMEASTAIVSFFPHVIDISSSISWVFLADNTAAAPTRRIVLYEYDKNTSNFTWRGFITLTYPTATVHTIRGMRMLRELYTTGTVGVTGTTVTGAGTLFTDSRLCVGSRIGFGSTNPNNITTWYQISAIGSNTSITLTTSAPTLTSGTPYVIEDLRCITTTTNATATNGGLFLTKGLRIEDFTISGTVIPAATTVDNIKAVYWLADAGTVLNTAACGSAIGNLTSFTDQRVYVLDVNTVRVYVYNIRAALAGLTAGRSTSAFVFRTGNQAVVGTISLNNNGIIATASHGPGSGVESLYFVTNNRIYRSAISSITDGSTTWQSDLMLEVPPGSTTTIIASGGLSIINYESSFDRFILITSGVGGSRSYVTRYNTISDPMDNVFLIESKVLNQSISDIGASIHPSIHTLAFSICSEGGILYLIRNSAFSSGNQLYSLPLAAHLNYGETTNNVLISPRILTPNANRYYRIYVNNVRQIGSDTLGTPPESFKVYYRTSGISDNSGSWTLLGDDGDLTSVSPSTAIQFRFLFNVIGSYCIPSRLLGFTVVFEDDSGDSHYEPSRDFSDISTNRFAYRQATLWGGNIPNLRIRLYNVSTNTLVLDDNVISSSLGTFEYSNNNGSTWNAWSNTQDVVGNYIRYTATTLPAGIRVRVSLTQA